MKNYAIIPVESIEPYASNYSVFDNIINVVTSKLGIYTDIRGIEKQDIRIVPSVVVYSDNWSVSMTNEINTIWSSYTDENIKITTDIKLLGVRYETLSEYVFTEDRFYALGSEINIKDVEFTNLTQSNCDDIVDNLYDNRADIPFEGSSVKFNLEPSPAQLVKLQDMVENNGLVVFYKKTYLYIYERP